MEFDIKAFTRAKFAPNEEDVSVPDLKPFFKGEGAPTFRVRGLTGEELYRVKQASETTASMKAMLEALSAGASPERVEKIREAFGLGGTAPEEYAKRIEMLCIATVKPKIDRPTVVKLFTCYPATMSAVSDTILKLTGMGQTPGKPKGSGETHGSATP
jgi:hypothetical protein